MSRKTTKAAPLQSALDASYAAWKTLEAARRKRGRAEKAGCDDMTRRRLERECTDLTLKKCELHHASNEAFAASRGWRVGKWFTLRQLQARSPMHSRADYSDCEFPDGNGIIDHAAYLTETVRPYRPVAALSHTYYRDKKAIRKYAERHGLTFEILPFKSTYYPGACWPVLFTSSGKAPVIGKDNEEDEE